LPGQNCKKLAKPDYPLSNGTNTGGVFNPGFCFSPRFFTTTRALYAKQGSSWVLQQKYKV